MKWMMALLVAVAVLKAQQSAVLNLQDLRAAGGKLELAPEEGVVLLDEGFAAANDNWQKPKSYENMTRVALDEKDGVKCLLVTRNPEIDPKTVKKIDTAWEMQTRRFMLPEGAAKYTLRFEARSNNAGMNNAYGHQGSYMNKLTWHDSEGKTLEDVTVFQYNVSPTEYAVKDIHGDVPKGAASVELMIGADLPDLKEGEFVAFRQVKLSILRKVHGYRTHGECLTGAFPVQRGEGRFTFKGVLTTGVSLQLSTSADIHGSPLSWTPFAGPDGTDGTWFADNSPLPKWPENAKYMRLRVRLQGDGGHSPLLEKIIVGQLSIGSFVAKTREALPHARRLSASPTLESTAPFRFRMIADNGAVPKLTQLKLNDADAMAFASFHDDAVTVTPPDGFRQGLNFITAAMEDCDGRKASEELVLYIGEPRRTNVVTMRDDGMTLVDGKPFFPIGMAFVKKCDHNGNSYERLFQMLEDCGVNFARNYSDFNVTSPEFDEFAATAEKHNVKLYISSSTGGVCDKDTRRLAQSIVLQNNLKHIAWDTGDDTASFITPEQLDTRYQAVKAIDPLRITTQADDVGHLEDPAYAQYAPYSDNFSPEIYPYHNPRSNSDAIAVPVFISSMKRIRDSWKATACPVRSCWPLIGYFTNCGNNDKLPNAVELRAMTYQCIIHGAQGVIWYRYAGYRENSQRGFLPEEWEVLANQAKELRSIYDVLCARASAKQPTVTVVSGETFDPLGNESVSALLKESDGKLWLFTASSVRTPVQARFRLPARATKATDYFENRVVKITDGAMAETFAPLGVHVYVIE